MNAVVRLADRLADRFAQQAPWLHARLVAVGPQLERAGEVLNFAAHRARDVRLAQVAGSLTFTTVLSLVPLLAVLLAIFAAFPPFAELRADFERNVLRALLPEQYAVQILRYLNGFAGKAARLTALGLAFLVVTALTMIHTVDRVLNDIWQVRARRPLLQRLLVYWVLLTFGPLLLAASVSASSYLLSMPANWAGRGPNALRLLLDYAPLLLAGLAFAALFVVVPMRRVAWRDALIGGFIAAILSELLKEAFGVYIRAGNVASIYGAFAAAPLFLLWVYLSWYALLFGAALAATLPRLRATRFADEQRAGNRFLTAVALLRRLLAARAAGDGRLRLAALAQAVHAYPEEVEQLLLDLEALDYVSRVVADGEREPRWLLTCDPARATLVPLFARLAVDPGNSLLARPDALPPAWMQQGLAADWVAAPLTTLLAPPEARDATS